MIKDNLIATKQITYNSRNLSMPFDNNTNGIYTYIGLKKILNSDLKEFFSPKDNKSFRKVFPVSSGALVAIYEVVYITTKGKTEKYKENAGVILFTPEASDELIESYGLINSSIVERIKKVIR